MPDTVCCTANRIASHIVQQIGAHLGACKVKCGMRGMPCYHHLPLFKPAVCIPHLYVWHHLTLKDPTYSYCCSYSPSLKSPWLTHYPTANTLSNGQHTNQRLTHYLINDTWVTRPTLAVQFVSFYFLSALNLFLTSLLCFVDRFTSLYAEPGKICMTTGGSLTLLSQGTVCPHHSGGLISSWYDEEEEAGSGKVSKLKLMMTKAAWQSCCGGLECQWDPHLVSSKEVCCRHLSPHHLKD